MLEVFGAWAARLILLLVAAGVIQLVLPGGSLRRYVELVVGLTVLAVVLTPLLGWLGSDFEWAVDQVMATFAISDGGANAASAAASAGAVWREQAVNEATAVQLESWLRQQLRQQFGVDARARVSLTDAGQGQEAHDLQIELELRRVEPQEGPDPARSVVTNPIQVGPIGPIKISGSAGADQLPRHSHVGEQQAEGGMAGDDLVIRVRSWVASALGIDERNVHVRREEVLP